MLVEFGKSNLIQKARQQPDKVKQVLEKIKTDGLMPTLEAVFTKLGEPLPLGYCNVGKVIGVGEGVNDFKIGDRVASNGHHAEFVCIPKNLVAHIPDNISDEEACFTVIGSIGLQGIRLLNPTLGETVVVMGLGLIGLITAQLLLSNGCRVIGVDLDDKKLAMAEEWGVIPFNSRNGDVVKFVEEQTGNYGADGVIITASAKTNDIISQAAKMSRKRGRIVLVGVIGLNLSRAEFYEKELSFQVSCSYGPGRYDDKYEQQGIDYPLAFVRWTEKRNFETILNKISTQFLKVNSMISEIIELDDYLQIYGDIGQSRSIASILKYNDLDLIPERTIKLNDFSFQGSKGVVGIIGAGNFTKMTMLPSLKDSQAKLKYIASNGGVTGTSLAKKYSISRSTTDYSEILKDSDVDLVMITTRHDSHAKLVIETLNSGKNVFVEKPLALTIIELNDIIEAQIRNKKVVTVGFNRRFSPHIQKIKQHAGNTQMNVIATMNAGHIPYDFWVHDLKIGGGRIIGEACHYIDLITYLTGSKVVAVCMNSLGVNPEENTDNASILLKYENGSTGVINYFSNGSKAYSKERVEVYSQERTFVMDNFRKTEGFGAKGFSNLNTRIDKGHKNQFETLIGKVIEGGESIIPFDEIINTSKAAICAIESLKQGAWVQVN
ncbi:bi-domain-containing oxidoreductase [Sphingobacterium kyonggiense]|uniref:Bi-domain-containing oxidoreductase n=2 Tax=Sphingobacterium kyonggiense TaxID=714075 RepID=A0ABP7Z4U4_9SPHI